MTPLPSLLLGFSVIFTDYPYFRSYHSKSPRAESADQGEIIVNSTFRYWYLLLPNYTFILNIREHLYNRPLPSLPPSFPNKVQSLVTITPAAWRQKLAQSSILYKHLITYLELELELDSCTLRQ